MTATPWRLSKTEGFNHLFDRLILGPQIHELQRDCHLCKIQLVMPAPDELVRGGLLASTGDYSESGIELANQDRPDVMTGGAFQFWQTHAQDRQTIIYAVSAGHAKNLAVVFNNANVPAGVILDETPREERKRRIKQFSDGELRVLINKEIATEGFDLPDASCIVLARPTMSLALYLQMVGRGLRRKDDGGDCMILDLADNSERHGLPNEERHWSLDPRGRQAEGGLAPVVRCPECEGVSPAASQSCQFCEGAFGKSCQRCGVWRPWKRWSLEEYCGNDHDLVCDMCHYDAHKSAFLPVGEHLRDKLLRESENDSELKYDWARFQLNRYRNSQLRDLLEEERSFVRGMDQDNLEDLRRSIQEMDSALSDDGERDKLFDAFLSSLPPGEAPRSYRDTTRLYSEWENHQKAELVRWQRQLTDRESEPIDKHFVLYCARGEVMRFRDLIWSDSPGHYSYVYSRDPDRSYPALYPRGGLRVSVAFDPDHWWREDSDLFVNNLLMENLLLESHATGLWPDDGWVALDWLHAWKDI